jgi:phenylacetic acid degradation operon negative regulatory protein
MALSPFGTKARVASRPIPTATQGPLEKFGVLQPQEVILGLFGEYVSGDERAWSGGLVQLLGDLGFSSAASRVALNRVIARGLLAPVKEGRFVFYVITPRLRLVHEEGRKQTFSPVADVAWTGEWTMVWYTIPEQHRVQRARLGRWLNLRGFGALQDSTWIAPGNHQREIVELSERLKLRDHVVVFGGTLAEDSDVRQIVARGWNVKDLKAMYEIFVKEFSPYLKPGKSSAITPRDSFIVRTRLIEMFRTTVSQDPQLSDDVLAVKWRRREAIELFQTLQLALQPAATEYFRGHAITGQFT